MGSIIYLTIMYLYNIIIYNDDLLWNSFCLVLIIWLNSMEMANMTVDIVSDNGLAAITWSNVDPTSVDTRILTSNLTHWPLGDFKNVIFNLALLVGILKSPYDNVLRWMPQYFTDDKSTLVQVMAWCHQATNHYLNQCWPRSPTPYGVTRPQWSVLT